MSAQAAEVLRLAAQEIEKRGHGKTVLENEETGAVCMWGAINLALSGYSESEYMDILQLNLEAEESLIRQRTDLTHSLRKLFWRKFNLSDSDIYPGAKWNDLPETTGKDVQKFLLQTADEIEVL